MGTIFVDNIKNNVGGKKLNIGDSSINVDDAGAVTINAGSDIRLANGNWTGNAVAKIQHHNEYSHYIYLYYLDIFTR